MNPFDLPFALISMLGMIAIIPVWMWFLGEYRPEMPIEAQFISALILPATAALFIAGWVQPG